MRIFPLLGWMIFPGCWAVMGPETVRGPLGGSVTVRCQYPTGYEDYPKFWCQAGAGLWSCPAGHIVESSGTESEAKWGRVSIRDNHTLAMFTVTVKNLTLADAGTYLCGIRRRLILSDLKDTVTVLVSPEPTSTWTTAEQRQSSSPTSQHTTSPGSQLSNVHFLLLILWKVPVFLCIMGVNVWYRKTPGRGQTDMVGASKFHTLSYKL